MENNIQNQLQLNDEIKVTDEGKPILGVLEGPCADFKAPTRNGRKYDDELWEKVFSDKIVNELIENGGIPGELDHPADRTETCSEKIAILMKEKPTKKNGKLWAKFHILNTPCGKIAYTLAKAGFKLGISSRGSGETYTGSDGDEHVDPDSYEFVGFDLVLIPAVKSARLNLITESLNKGTSKIYLNEDVRKALNESLDDASEDDRRVMLETLHNLNIEINGDFVADDDINSTQFTSSDISADNDGDKVLDDLKRVLKENRDLNRQVQELQEKLSVCYTKDASSDDNLAQLTEKVNKLAENLSLKSQEVQKLSEQVELRNQLIVKLKGSQEAMAKAKTTLTESASQKDARISELSGQVRTLNENLKAEKETNEKSQKLLKEQLQEFKTDLTIKKTEFSQKLEKLNTSTAKWKSVAQTAVDKYISLKAQMFGLTMVDVKSRLPESYSFNDIDRVCESLKTQRLSANSLPFDASHKSVKARLPESTSPVRNAGVGNSGKVDDEVDDSLASLANITL